MLAGGGVAHTSGGVGTLMLYLMDEWGKQAGGPRVRVIDTRGQGGAAGGIARFAAAIAGVGFLGAARRIDVVHAHMTTRGSVVRKSVLCQLAMALDVPVIMHMHGADFFAFYRRQPRVFQAAIRALLRRCRHVIVLGQAWRDFLVTELGVSAGRIAIVPNGVPSPALGRRVRPDRPPELLFLGRLGARKGVPELIEALAAPALRARDWHATIAGDGDAAPFRAAVQAHGLDGRVELPGWTDRTTTARMLAGADMLLLPSHHEALPIAVLEALAQGVAVITTPVGSVPEFLEDGVNALLVPPGDVGALAGAIIRLLDDPPERERLGMAGRRVFALRLDVAVMAMRVAQLYREACAPACVAADGGGGQHAVPARLGGMHAVLRRVMPMAGDAEVAALVAELAAAKRVMVVSFANQHGVNLCWSRPGFAGLLAGADVLLRDGVGVELCLAALGRAPGVNMVGTDFIPRLVRAFAGRRVALYGTSEPWLGRAAAALRAQGCRLVSVRDGFADAARYVDDVAASGPDLVVLAMGMGKQEEVAQAIAAASARAVVVVNGGAIADYWGGRFARAPRWMLAARLEWLFRLVLEPRRLWRRYVTGGIVFLWRALRLVLAVRRGVLPGIR